MTTLQGRDVRGLDALRREVALLLLPMSRLALAGGGELGSELGGARCYAEAVTHADTDATRLANGPDGGGFGDSDLATSSEDSEADRTRLIALVELARGGDAEAFGALYDHYQPSVYRFLFYRTRSSVLAEDLTSETFLRALRNMSNFRWQGRDFGAWLMTIARNLATDHFKAGRNRREFVTEDMSAHDAPLRADHLGRHETSQDSGTESPILLLLGDSALLTTTSNLLPAFPFRSG